MRAIVRNIVLAFAVVGSATPAFADAKTDAKAHYQAGVSAYSSQDYRAAIREFSAAQQLFPADLNNYNLALCYDKLGDPEPAIQYYRAYLDRVPTSDKRAEIEASVSRLEAAQKSVGAKRAQEEAARVEAQRRADEEARRAEEARKADEARRAEEARKAEEARRAQQGGVQDPYGPTSPPTTTGGGPAVVTGGGSTGTPGTGGVVTGDNQLDRVQQIDVNQIRDQRGMADTRVNPGAAGTGVAVAGATAGAPQAGAPNGPNPNGQVLPTDQPKPETPVYKKWWFWAVVAVSAYVVYEIASSDSSNNSTVRGREVLPLGNTMAQPGGMTLMRW